MKSPGIIHTYFSSLLIITMAMAMTAGCSRFNSRPEPKHYFDLDLRLPATTSRDLGSGNPLMVRELDMAPGFDSHQFIYRINSDEYINDFYNEFVSYPARLVTDKISEYLYATKFFTRPRAADRDRIRFRLSGKINQFYGDFRNKNAPRAVMEIHLILEENINDQYQVVMSRMFNRSSPVGSTSPSDLSDGWSRGLGEIIEDVLTELNLQ